MVSDRRPRSAPPDDPTWVETVRAVYVEVGPRLWRSLVAWSSSTEVAEEALAEAFAQLIRRGAEVRDPEAWVWRAAFRLAAGDLQRRRQRPVVSLDAAERDGRLAHATGRIEGLPAEAADLVRALARLSDQQRRCVALVDVAGHTAVSAAAVLGTTPATVRVQLMRARRRLRAELTAADDRDPAPTDPTATGEADFATTDPEEAP